MAEEQKLQKLILDDLEYRPEFFVFKIEKANRNGVPDIIFMCPKGTFFIEVKAPGKKPQPHQQVVINRINSTGGAKAYYCDTWAAWSVIKAEILA